LAAEGNPWQKLFLMCHNYGLCAIFEMTAWQKANDMCQQLNAEPYC